VFRTIAIGLDGSDGATQALTFAVELAKREGGRLVIVHVEEDIAGKAVARSGSTKTRFRRKSSVRPRSSQRKASRQASA
jgi:nucleotide-binding universal stress UspA family protein